MTTTANMGLVLPNNHGSTDTWDVILETLFNLVDQHDHSTGKGVKVPSGGLKINADVSWSFAGTNYAITDAKAVDFTPVAAATMAGYSSALFVNASDANNLYFRNASGTNVRITSGGTLDVSVVGGIGGDYASVSALLDFDDASDTYRLRQQVGAFVRQYAKAACADLQLFEYKLSGLSPVPSNSVRLKSPTSLAASYDVTFPAAGAPSQTTAVQMTSTGDLVVDGNVKHGDMVLNLSPHSSVSANPATDNSVYGQSDVNIGSSGSTFYLNLPLRQGDRIKSITFARFGNGVATLTTSVNVVTAGGATTGIGSAAGIVPAAVWADTTIDVTDTTLAAGESLHFAFAGTGASVIRVGNVRVTYDRP